MAVDRTKTLRPGVIDIANIVDQHDADLSALETLLTPQIYDSSVLTFRNGFEPYDETSELNKIRIVKQANFVNISGAVKKVGAQSAAGDVVMANLPNFLLPATRHNAINGATGMNRYLMSVNPSSAMYAGRFGTDTMVAIPDNTWLRIDIVYCTL